MTAIATQPAWPSTEWDGTVERLPATQRQSQGERMREWLHLFKECREAAEILARTSFVPKDMMGKPAEIATSMLKGWELGLDPLDALASIYVVHGRVGFYAEFMRRRMIQAGHVFRVVESNDSRCVVEGTRADNGETHRAVFTAEQAKRANIDIKAYPAEKLVARATSRLVKQAFPDVLSGSLIVEDLLDGMIAVESERVDPSEGSASPQVAAPIQRRRQPRAVKAKPPTQLAPSASEVDDLLDDEPSSEDPVELPLEPIRRNPRDAISFTPEQRRKGLNMMFGLFAEADIDKGNRDDRLLVISAIVGETVTSSNDLTDPQLYNLVNTLRAWKEESAAKLGSEVTEILNRAALVEMEAEQAEASTPASEPDAD